MSNRSPRPATGVDRRLPSAFASLVLVLVAIIGAAVVYLSTPYGLGLRDDSYSYVTGAVSLAQGTGYGRLTGDGSLNPITNFPPLYSLALALPARLGIDVRVFARTLNGLLFGVTTLIGLMAVYGSTGSVFYAGFGAGLLLGSLTLIEQFTWLQSEPLFLCLQLLALVAIASYIHRPPRPVFLWLAAIASSLGAFTRFVGLGLILACGMALVLLLRKPLSARLKEAMSFMAVAVAPMIAFTIRNFAVKGSAANRPAPFWHPPPPEVWRGGLVLFLKWLLPDRVAAFLTDSSSMSLVTFLFLSVGAIWLGLRLARRANATSSPSLVLSHLSVQALFCLVYLGLIVFTVLLLDRLTPIDERILAPLHLSILLILALAAAHLSGSSSARARLSVAILCLGFAAFQIYRSGLIVESLARDGHGYSSERWRTSPTLAYARGLPAVPIFSNNLPAMYFIAGRTAYAIPSPTNLSNLEPNPSYGNELEEMRHLLRQGDGFLVLVGFAPTDVQGAEEWRNLTAGLLPVQGSAEGIVYRAAEP